MSLYSDLNEVLTPYAQRIKALDTKSSNIKADLDKYTLDFDVVEGKYISKIDGMQAASASYITSDYIGVNKHVWLYSFCGNDNSGYAFYDEAKMPVSYGGIYEINRTWTKLTVPAGAKYFRATCGVNQASEFKIIISLSDAVSKLMGDDVGNTLEGINYASGYIVNGSGTIGEHVANQNYVCKKILVNVGETYHINGSGATGARLWSTHDANGNTVRVADANTVKVKTAESVTIAEGEKYLVFNSTAASARYGITPGNAARSTYHTRDLLMAVESDVDNIEYTFRNNMSTDGAAKLPKCTITGTYGASGAKYSFNMPANTLHVYFEFKQTEAVTSTSSTSNNKKLVNAHGVGNLYLAYKGSVYSNVELFQKYTLQVVSGSNSVSLTPTDFAFARLNGEDAICIKYTNTVGNSSVGTVTFTDSTVVVDVDGTETTIDVTSSTMLADLVTSLDNISGISAKALVVSGKTYVDLLPVVSKSGASSTVIGLIYSGTLYDNTAYKDNPNVYIPLAVSNDWHSVEMIVNPDGNISAAIDGITVSAAYDSGATKTGTLIINDGGLPIVIRNLIVDYGGEGDAELIDNLVNPSSTPSKQLISSHNPRLVIYEGHGVDACTEAEAPVSDNMACSTERLKIVFETAKARGYVPVTWEQVIDWKLNGKPLPKRCFTLMFDDWRFSNFVDYEKRKPFVDFGVKAGLAVITNDKALTDSVTINDISYTVDRCVDIVKTAGWYPTSHTHTHRRMTDYVPSAYDALFKTDVLEADRFGIHSDILVYPNGDYEQQYFGALKHSGFALGVNIARNKYNCIGASNYYLARVEIGTRVSLATALYPLV